MAHELPSASNEYDPAHAAGHDDHEHGHSTRAGRFGAALREVFAPHSHDTADSIDGALESSAAGIRAVKVSLIALGATAVAQIVIVVVSGSVALLADTIHNFSDALTAIPLWIAFALGTKAATRRYTYGFGRAEDLAGLFVIAMIALSALVAGVESVRRLMNPVAIDHVGWVAVAGFVGFLGNEVVAVYRIRIGRRIGSAALVADGLHARTEFHLPGGAAGCRRRRARLPAGGPDHRSADHGRDPRRIADCVARHLPPTNGRRRPGLDRQRRDGARRRTWSDGGAQREDAMDRAPPARRRRTRHRPGDHPR